MFCITYKILIICHDLCQLYSSVINEHRPTRNSNFLTERAKEAECVMKCSNFPIDVLCY